MPMKIFATDGHRYESVFPIIRIHKRHYCKNLKNSHKNPQFTKGHSCKFL